VVVVGNVDVESRIDHRRENLGPEPELTEIVPESGVAAIEKDVAADNHILLRKQVAGDEADVELLFRHIVEGNPRVEEQHGVVLGIDRLKYIDHPEIHVIAEPAPRRQGGGWKPVGLPGCGLQGPQNYGHTKKKAPTSKGNNPIRLHDSPLHVPLCAS